LGKKKHRKKPVVAAQRIPAEDRRAEALTVAWMLSTMVTLGALVFSGIGMLVVPLLADQAGEAGALGVIPPLLLFVATVTGIVSLILMACAIRFRRSPPPRPVIIVSTAICLLPFGAHVLLLAIR